MRWTRQSSHCCRANFNRSLSTRAPFGFAATRRQAQQTRRGGSWMYRPMTAGSCVWWVKLTGEEHINASVCIRLLERLQARLHIYLEVRFGRPNEQIPAHCTNGSLIAQDGLCQSASEPNLGINRAEESGTSSRRPAPDPRWKPTSRQPQTTAVRLLQRLS